MGDPTGIGEAILRIIFFGYWGLVLLGLGLALWVPKHKLAKALLSLLVLGLFVGFPRYYFAKEATEREAEMTCPLQPYQSIGERSKGLQVN